MFIRLYQSYLKEDSRYEPTISDPMPADKFIQYIHAQYIDSCNCGLTNTLFDLSEITIPWLESLTHDTTMIIDDEESFLRIHIYNVEI